MHLGLIWGVYGRFFFPQTYSKFSVLTIFSPVEYPRCFFIHDIVTYSDTLQKRKLVR